MGRPVTATIGQEQWLGGVGEGNDQGMITPDTVVGDIDALLALGIGGDEGAVDVDRGLVEERGGLLSPNPLSGSVEGVHEVKDVRQLEPAAEVSRGGGIGNSPGAEGVEIDFVVASPLQMLDLAAAGQDIEGNIQDVIGLVIGKVAFEEMELLIDVPDQSSPASEQQHGADATRPQSLDPLGEFVVNVVGSDHGGLAFGTRTILDASEDSPLALAEFVEDSRIHSKASVFWNIEDVLLPQLFQNPRGFSSYFP